MHRRSVAAYIACYGLLGRAVPGLEHRIDSAPVRIEFETDQPTDDFTVRFADGSSAFASAKRECGNDAAFRATVDQWFEQAPGLGPNDLLLLTVARTKGDITGLKEGLDKRRSGIAAMSAAERKALQAFDDACAGKSSSLHKTVGDRAVLLRVDAARTPAPQYEMARDAIGGRLVPDEQATAALDVLSKAFHDQASIASGSDLDGWINALVSAGITVFADAEGPPGARRRAEQEALATYNEELVRSRGRVDLTLLAKEIPDLVVDDLVDGMQVEVSLREDRPEKVPLMAIVRGWERFVLVGLPGSGKSTAAREIAAACADDDEAPQPIMVDLRVLVRDHGSTDVRLHDLVRCAVRVVGPPIRSSLESALDLALRSGDALLILDGLDEVEPLAGQLAETLVGVLQPLSPDVGVVLATRGSGSAAASRLGLPVAGLSRPADLDKTLSTLLRHIAARRVDEAERDEWVRAREEWLTDKRRNLSTLMEVPLLAVILVLMLADNDPSDVATKPARLLHDAVIDSAERWESLRDARPAERRARGTSPLTPKVLTESFAEIGHVLLDDPETVRSTVVTRVAGLFSSDRWRRAPADAEEIASAAVDFWDDVIAVFAFDSNGRSVPRSRVFVEVACAMWATSGDDERLRSWVAEAVSAAAMSNALDLAAQLDERTLDAALALCESSAEAVRFLARTAVGTATDLGEERAAVLARFLRAEVLDAAASAGAVDRGAAGGVDQEPDGDDGARSGSARNERRVSPHGGDLAVDGSVWPPVAMLCLIEMPEPVRTEMLDGLLDLDALDGEQRVLGQGLLALARAGDRALSPGEVDAVRAALLLPLPEKKEPRHEDGVLHIESGPPLRLGLAALAEKAAHRVHELDAASLEAIQSISGRCSWGRARRIIAALSRQGADTGDFFSPSFRETFAGLADLAHTLGPRPEVHMLRQLVAIDPDVPAATGPLSWRMREVRQVAAAAGWHSISLPDLTSAFFEETGLLHDWLIALCRRIGVDPAYAASQARRAVEQEDQARLLDELLDVPPLDGADPTREPGSLSAEEVARLERAVSSSSRWIRSGAAKLLAEHRRGEADQG